MEGTAVRQDESTEMINVRSLSMRGAQRDITGWLIKNGYEPAGRWTTAFQTEDPETGQDWPLETFRQFRPAQ